MNHNSHGEIAEEDQWDNNGLPKNLELMPNGLPKDYGEIVKRGDPDGSDPNNPVRIYADGVFDMYHIGHAKVLEQAKKLFKHTYLIVGVSGDEDVLKYKGQFVMSQFERGEILKHCNWVDEVICPCPWKTTPEWARRLNIHYMAHDDIPYTMGADATNDVYYDIKKAGMWRTTQRTQGVSTSDVVLRIIKDYDMYVERNLKRDYTPSDLGISHFKALRIKLRRKYAQLQSPWYSPLKLLRNGYEKVESTSSATWNYLFSPSKVDHLESDSSVEKPNKKQKLQQEADQEEEEEASGDGDDVNDQAKTMWGRVYGTIFGHESSDDEEAPQVEQESSQFMKKRDAKANRKQKKLNQYTQ